jgi:chromosome partitioning protein
MVLIDTPPGFPLHMRILLSLGDGFIVPCIPDILSVKGSVNLVNRLKSDGFKLEPVGTIWTLVREQNPLHRQLIDGVQHSRVRDVLPEQFEKVIPNATAIAKTTTSREKCRSFRSKYTPQFAQRFESICDELSNRCVRLFPAEPSRLIPQ